MTTPLPCILHAHPTGGTTALAVPTPSCQPPRQLSTHGDVRLPRCLPSFHGSRYVSCSTWSSGPPVSPRWSPPTCAGHTAGPQGHAPQPPLLFAQLVPPSSVVTASSASCPSKYTALGPRPGHSLWLRANQDGCDVSCLAYGTARGANLLGRPRESPRLTSVSSHSKGSKSVPESSNSCI